MNHDQSQFSAMRMPFGWAICATNSSGGIPVDCMSYVSGVATPDHVIDAGIAHHLKTCHGLPVVMVLVLPSDADKWRKAIEDELATRHPQERWWRGTDVGLSSASIFAVLCDDRQFKHEASRMGTGQVPMDHGDFGRCRRLLEAVPQWRPRLHEVGEAYPNSAWPEIIDSWDLLLTSGPKEVDAILAKMRSNPKWSAQG